MQTAREVIQATADYLSSTQDAGYRGESGEIYLVHKYPLAIGEIYRTQDGTVSVRVIREATAEEYRERCPHVPDVLDLSQCFIYLTTGD